MKIENSLAECLCDKCGYTTHVHKDFRYCPICGTILRRKVANLFENKDLCYPAIFGSDISSMNEPYVIVSQGSDITICHNSNELSSEVISAEKIVRQLIIVKQKNILTYGIVNTKGEMIVDFKYDDIQPFRYTCLPGPGPLPPIERWFIGAFFTLGNNVGYLRIYEDGHIAEYGMCNREDYNRKCRLT